MPLIREHAFNTDWYGAPAGIVEDSAFFALDPAERARRLAAFAWVEFREPLSPELPHQAVREAGFFNADTQVRFRIGLQRAARLPRPPNLEALRVESAEAASFRVEAEQMAPFEHERFALLPGMTPARLAERYARWANELVTRHPATCLRISEADGAPLGWFVANPEGGLLRLVLAMLHKDARSSGLQLYQRALVEFAARGHRVGFASFSVANTAVHNLYARLGAQFLAPEGVWMWVGRGG